MAPAAGSTRKSSTSLRIFKITLAGHGYALTVWVALVSYLNSLCLSFLIYTVEIIMDLPPHSQEGSSVGGQLSATVGADERSVGQC